MGERVGVILLNLGGPSSVEEIHPFLVRLFSDREIIRFPGGPLLQPLMARLIARLRLKAVRRNYAMIGGGSPLLRLTRDQAVALTRELRRRGLEATVTVAMRYTAPEVDEALAALGDVDRLVALTLYPQYSRATTGSSLTALRRAMEERGIDAPLAVVDRYPEHPGYLDAVAEKVRAGLEHFSEDRRADVVVLFSAHSLPKRFIDAGDPYVSEIELTVVGVRARLPAAQPWRLSYQSRTGPVEWVGPDTAEVVAALGREGVRDVLAVPIAFVSDHIETLMEIDLRYAAMAKDVGIGTFRRSESLNDAPAFIASLADLVHEALR